MFNRLRNFGDLGLMPLIVWLFLQLAMTGIFSPASASPDVDPAASSFPNTIVICTSSGFERITLNDNGSLPQDAPQQENYCPWCMHFGYLPSLVVPAVWQPAPRVFAGKIVWTLDQDKCAGQNESVQFQCRAPPL